jgi:NAD(P)-dependent dehydrogenase (short-subunit alcohol dehydrogenase family)
MTLDGRRALITGSGRGIGRAIARGITGQALNVDGGSLV